MSRQHAQPSPPEGGANRDAPLVSIICRTTGRSLLAAALDSLSCQTYRPLEIVLVDASGKGLEESQRHCGDLPVRMVGGDAPLRRPEAANAGLDAADGKFLLFLDDDDWLAPGHISDLMATLQARPEAGVAYSTTVETDARGRPTGRLFDIAWDPDRLARDNFIPIHSALFRRELLEQGCRFDEDLDIFEDWDFWLQLAERTGFVHVEQASAYYRQGGDSDTSSEDPSTRFREDHPIARGRERVFDKWLQRWDGARLNRILASLDQSSTVEQLHGDIARLNRENRETRSELRNRNLELNRLSQKLNKRSAELHDARARVRDREQVIRDIQQSFSWRITGPYRWLRRRLSTLAPLSSTAGAGNDDNGPPDSKEIHASLDMPGEIQREFSATLTVKGWCCAPAGIERIEAWVDDAPRKTITPGLPRPDIEALYPGIEGAASSGFRDELALKDLPPGQHRLELHIFDRSGNRKRVCETFELFQGNDLYNAWYWRNTPADAELEELRSQAVRIDDPPHFHLLVCPGDDDDALLKTLASIEAQCVPFWSVHLPGEPGRETQDLLRHTNLEPGRNLHFHDTPGPALEDVDGWKGCLRAGEILAPHALWEFAQATADGPELMYSDHDRYDETGMHGSPCFTPGWSPDHLLASNHVGGFFLTRRPFPMEVAAPGDPAWRYACLLALSEHTGAITRIPRMLWSQPASPEDGQQSEAETAAVREALRRRDSKATLTTDDRGIRHLHYPVEGEPLVSIIIPTTGRLDLVKPCLGSLAGKTRYRNYEVIILDNSHGDNPEGIAWLGELGFRVIECDEPFNWSRLNNIGAAHARGELLLFLNDDMEIRDPDWLEELAGQALRPGIGAAGARLLYPDGSLQHSGILLVNYGGGGIHLLRQHPPGPSVYRHLDQTQREVSANTGACLMVRRECFEDLGGFDEKLAVVGNDVDFCLRLTDRGYRNIWTPDCSLIHHESISRKSNVPKENEKRMWSRWGKRFIAGDEYYNPNLSLEHGDFSLRSDLVVPPSANRLVAGADDRAASRAGSLMPGVNLIGFIRAEMGVGEGARSDARALDAVDEPFGIISFESGNPSRMSNLSWQHKEIDDAPYDITLLHINPDHAEQAIAELPANCFEGRYCIGYWAWELPELPDDWQRCFQYFDEIWVPSRFVQEAVAIRSPVPVLRMPHCIEVSTDPSMDRPHFGLPDDTFLFLSMFDTHSRAERKNPYAAIRAFREAFAPDDPAARLIVKVNNPTPDGLQSLRQAIANHDNILVLDAVYSRIEINSLIGCVDCLVSLHRSEGFGLPPAEAMALGKATILTNWSGNTDYMTPDNSIAIDCELIELQEDHGPYTRGQYWADPDVARAAGAMRRLADNPEEGRGLGENARRTIEQNFSPEPVGRLMRRRLAAIRASRSKDS